jgi:hypothetical protein
MDGRTEQLPLMGVVKMTHAKDYVYPKFLEMWDTCCKGLVDLLWVSDDPLIPFENIVVDCPGPMSEDMMMLGRNIIRVEARSRHAPSYLFQGLDCLYRSRQDFEHLLASFTRSPCKIAGGLTSARSDSHHAVARIFKRDEHGAITEAQSDWPDEELVWAIQHGATFDCGGFVGADALLVDHSLFEYDFSGHTPWYVRVEQGRENLCAEEWMILKMVRDDVPICLDASVCTWHVHESGGPNDEPMAHMYPGIDKLLSELSWS